MEIGIVGLSLSGKTTLFNLLTRSDAETGFGAGKKVNLGISQVPDARVDKLSEIWNPKKTTYTTVNYVDLSGIELAGSSKGFSAEALTHLKNTDALLVVVRGFTDESVPHPEGSVDALRDVELIQSEFLLSDLVIIENRLERLSKQMKGKPLPEHIAEKALFEKCKAALDDETPLRVVEFTTEESRLIKGFQFLTLKPQVIALNLGEDELTDGPTLLTPLVEKWAGDNVRATYMAASIEREIGELSGEDAKAFLEDYGLTEPATDRIIRESYGLLGLISFFTMGEDECRAWTVRRGAKAPRAAGVIHTDLEKGFIRAEVVSYDDFVEAGSQTACRNRGLLRLEGKDYVVVDGDILNIRFNV